MGWLGRLLGSGRGAAPRAESASFAGLNDPAFYEFIRSGGGPSQALQVSAVFRSVALISGAIGMLPLRLMQADASGALGQPAADHPLYSLLMFEPNSRQSAYQFKHLMQLRLMLTGNAYARIVRLAGRVTGLIPIDPAHVTPVEQDDGTLIYRVSGPRGTVEYGPGDILHLYGFSVDGVSGLSMVDMAAEAIGLSRDAAASLARLYNKGITAGGALTTPHKLSLEAKGKLKTALESYAGASRAGAWMVLDEGMKAEAFNATARDSQTLETRRHQVEDIARFFGVPRPLLGLDDTTWGSGVEQLAILFVRFALAPNFTIWEQAVRRSLLTRPERAGYAADFDEQELLRGSMKDQAEFFAKALGSGGHHPWLTPNEVRTATGFQPLPDGDSLAPVHSNSPQG